MNNEGFKPNYEQSAAIESQALNILCIAGAGSGKTSTLSARIHRLLQRGILASGPVQPRDIIAITYTNAAARELRERIGQDLGFIGTLHSWLLREIKQHHNVLGLPETVSILDEDNKLAVIEKIISQMKIKESVDLVLEETRDEMWMRPPPSGKTLSRIQCAAVEYHQTLRRHGILDFDTILMHGKRLASLLGSQKALHLTTKRHLFVDEYQDSSDVDAYIYENWPFMTRFMVGDPDQSIFAFRGGNVRNICRLAEDDGYQVFTLQRNHRCGRLICEAAQKLIEHNSLRYPKSTIAVKEDSELIIRKCVVPGDELFKIVHDVEDARKSGETIGILCRTNAQLQQVVNMLASMGLLQSKTNELPRDWRVAKLWLAFMQNPWNDFIAHRFLVAHLGNQSADKIRSECALAGVSINEGHFGIANVQFDGRSPNMGGYSAESHERINQCIDRLLRAGKFTLQDLILALDHQEAQNDHEPLGVTAMTMHGAKGLEFDRVIVLGCEEGFCPSLKKDSNIEEERRLFYVAMTRARSHLTLSWCEKRPQNRGPNVKPGPLEDRQISRFMAEACV